MITLQQLLDERSLDTELAIHAVKEWLQQKRKEFEKGDLILTDLGVIDELLEELEG